MREAGRHAANAFRIAADKPEKKYESKEFSKTEAVKKPFVTQRKILEEILDYTERAIEKCEQLSKQAQRNYPLKQDTSEMSLEEFAEQGMREGMAIMQRGKKR